MTDANRFQRIKVARLPAAQALTAQVFAAVLAFVQRKRPDDPCLEALEDLFNEILEGPSEAE